MPKLTPMIIERQDCGYYCTICKEFYPQHFSCIHRFNNEYGLDEESEMNPDTNKFEKLFNKDGDIDDEYVAKQMELREEFKQLGRHNTELEQAISQRTLVRPNGEPIPKHWSIFQVGENYVINDYTFKCKYIGETSILFEPVGPVEIGKSK